jgi:hypothetical protein
MKNFNRKGHEVTQREYPKIWRRAPVGLPDTEGIVAIKDLAHKSIILFFN